MVTVAADVIFDVVADDVARPARTTALRQTLMWMTLKNKN